MTKKNEIVTIAAELIHEYGYHNIGIKKILNTANIPKGSFYHYFESKEELALCIIDYHIENTKQTFRQVEKSINGLRDFFNKVFTELELCGYKKGCPIGNLILELADVNESFRRRLLQWNEYLEKEIKEILIHSKLQKEITPGITTFIIASFEGAIMKAKLEKNRKAIDAFNNHIFECLLKEAGK